MGYWIWNPATGTRVYVGDDTTNGGTTNPNNPNTGGGGTVGGGTTGGLTATEVNTLITTALAAYTPTSTLSVPVNPLITAALIPFASKTGVDTSIATALVPYSNTVQMNAAIAAAVAAIPSSGGGGSSTPTTVVRLVTGTHFIATAADLNGIYVVYQPDIIVAGNHTVQIDLGAQEDGDGTFYVVNCNIDKPLMIYGFDCVWSQPGQTDNNDTPNTALTQAHTYVITRKAHDALYFGSTDCARYTVHYL